MGRIFAEVPEAISNTVLIADRCEVDLGFKGYHLPDFPVPEGYDAESYLRKLCEEGLKWRYGAQADAPHIRERLEYELGIIQQMGFDAYFLIVWDLCCVCQTRRYLVQRPRFSGRFDCGLYPGNHLGRSHRAWPDLRTLPQSRTCFDAGYRPGFPG